MRWIKMDEEVDEDYEKMKMLSCIYPLIKSKVVSKLKEVIVCDVSPLSMYNDVKYYLCNLLNI